jgi:DNA-directed RNA polymerase specialized sigma subunit
LPQDQWHTLLLDAHPAYITWEQYQDNCRSLQAHAQAHGSNRRKSPPGLGPALLQGLVVCGICGQRMTVHYDDRHGRLRPWYVCQGYGIQHAQRICQSMPGSGIDEAIGEVLLEMVTPVGLEVAWAVQQELQSRLEEADRLRRQQVERAQYDADQARNRYMKVDPTNRLVADALEADWNEKLRALGAAQEDYQRQCQADRAGLDEAKHQQVLSLAGDFPRLWKDPQTTDQDRKRMVRLLIEDVTLVKAEKITASIRFKGGATRTLTLSRPLPAFEARRTSQELVAEIDRLLDTCTDKQIACELNLHGWRTGTGQKPTAAAVSVIRKTYQLRDLHERLRQKGMLTQAEIAEQLGVSEQTVIAWRKHGLLRGVQYNDKRQYVYEPVVENKPVRTFGWKLSERRRFPEVHSDPSDEVQREA